MKKYEPPTIEGGGNGVEPRGSSVLVVIGGIAVYLVVVTPDGTQPPDPPDCGEGCQYSVNFI